MNIHLGKDPPLAGADNGGVVVESPERGVLRVPAVSGVVARGHVPVVVTHSKQFIRRTVMKSRKCSRFIIVVTLIR